MASRWHGSPRPPGTRSARLQGALTDSAHLFALCGFAIAQPLFDLLGKNPTFFIAHGLRGLDIALIALALIVVPPLALLAVLALARLAGPGVARVVRAVLAGGLIALTLLPPVERALGLSTATWIVAGLVFLVLAAWLYDRFVNVRTFVTYLTPMPILFVVILLFISPASALVTSSDPSAADIELESSRTPVIVVVFDEFSLPLLLDEHGAIDAGRFPGFARLAANSTWYPKATTSRSLTQYAVPQIESSILRNDSPIALASAYPRNLFTALGRSHDLHVHEPVTALCPDELCANPGKPTGASLPSDLGVVLLHQLLPEKTASKLGVPTLSDRWAGFDANPTFSSNGVTSIFQIRNANENGVNSQAELDGFEKFIASLGTGSDPGLWFQHTLLPHVPHSLLPGGYAYNWRYLPDGNSRIAADPQLAEVDAQRLMLQTLRVDSLVTEMLDRLEATDMLDRSLIVVTADHGSNFVAGFGRRYSKQPDSLDGMLPVPLFVHFPDQKNGRVDRREARTLDILPTIVDALGLDLPSVWKFDGKSLLGPPESPRVQTMDGVPVGPPHPRRMAARLAAYLSTDSGEHDPYRLGPNGDLVATTVSSHPQSSAEGTVRFDNARAYDAIDLHAVIPALFEADVTGVQPGDWVAIAVNGTIAGVGPAYSFNNVVWVAAMLDPSFMRNGSNRVDVYRVDADGSTLHPLTQS